MDTTSPQHNIAPAGGHGGVLSIDLDALASNYRRLSKLAGPVETAAAVKGDGYGLGLNRVVQTLSRAGCRTFFVAHLGEAEALRRICPPDDATIYVLNGLMPAMAPALAAIHARPVLGSVEEIEEWRSFANAHSAPPAAIHIDTGFTRLGLAPGALDDLVGANELFSGMGVALLMSHLACADEPEHPMNREQLARFRQAVELFTDIPASLASSAGIALGTGFHFDMVRPGIALYGGRARISGENAMQRVIGLEVPTLQIRDAEIGSTAGYGATYQFEHMSRVALVSIGYADGFFRSLSASNQRAGGRLFIAGTPCPIVGRVSMDITAIDVSHIGEQHLERGAMVEVFGDHQSIDDLAAAAGTIGYEVLTHLGLRHARVYSGS